MLPAMTLTSSLTPASNSTTSIRVPNAVAEVSVIDTRTSFGPVIVLQAQQRLVVKKYRVNPMMRNNIPIAVIMANNTTKSFLSDVLTLLKKSLVQYPLYVSNAFLYRN